MPQPLHIHQINDRYPVSYTGTYTTDINADFQGTFHFYDGLCHRDNDLPAIICKDGTRFWYNKGLCHRIGDPAIEWADGSEEWLQKGLWHRLSGPARKLKPDPELANKVIFIKNFREEYWLEGTQCATYLEHRSKVYWDHHPKNTKNLK